jgi:hypothetical protein
MAEDNNKNAPEAKGGGSPNEVALEMMKFIAVTTGYGKGSATAAGFGGKSSARTPEEHASALLELFEKCRTVVNK